MKNNAFNFSILGLMLVLIFLHSCANTDNPENGKTDQYNYDVEYDILSYNKDQSKYYTDESQKELFTGTAGSKNSSDEIVKYAEFKNGYLVKRKQWTDFGGELHLTEDMEYKDGEKYNGWYNSLEERADIIITSSYFTYKNGKAIKDKGWLLAKYGSWLSKSSYLMIGDENTSDATCKGEDSYDYPNGGGGDTTKIRNFLRCVQDQNLEHFHMYIFE